MFSAKLTTNIIVILREWKSGLFSMPDMNTAFHTQERNDVSSRWYRQQSMSDRRRSKVWIHFSKCGADYACCNICDAMCKASGRKTSNLRNHLQCLPLQLFKGGAPPTRPPTPPKRITACSNSTF
ncbi:hypothetical protein ILYODFUR_035182 [Ilyodon furcidens]|uniref:BED-type domain-containing protein n=1 Tax=Ilyodon furcidens TaxID=33524 RepID=A0ABV0V8Q7_9TELE